MSRSVTVAVVYVMCVTSLSWRDALKVVRGARNVANPNVGFLKQLQDFESDRMAEVSVENFLRYFRAVPPLHSKGSLN
ncbi:Dual specificity protein phosphatase 22 [Portunus trituberculatus]|uniref:Dual specificity protein phosphatase 22 n=1 Tax=Portunus trituberculatus TaxID=210409 RepID=A0A5B7K7T5_PORTR|nr:Dual specificity protein phosphatase 22 [Portunus trituberculatus]